MIFDEYSDEIAKLPDILVPIAIMDLVRAFIKNLERMCTDE